MKFLQIVGDRLAEGFKHGDLLEVVKPVEPFEGKVVVARLDRERAITIRRYHKVGRMIEFTSFEGNAVPFKVPKDNVTILYVVKSWTRPFKVEDVTSFYIVKSRTRPFK